MKSRQRGFSLVELLITLAIVSVAASIALFNSRNVLTGEQTRGAATAFQQMLWQAGTSASARFEPVVLSLVGGEFVLRGQTSGKILRRERVSASVTTTFPTNRSLVFTPSGRIDATSFDAVAQPVRIASSKLTYAVFFTVIGEARMEVSR